MGCGADAGQCAGEPGGSSYLGEVGFVAKIAAKISRSWEYAIQALARALFCCTFQISWSK